jgi:hypothetical protein
LLWISSPGNVSPQIAPEHRRRMMAETREFGFRRGSRTAHHKPLTMHQRCGGLSRVRRRAERRAPRLANGATLRRWLRFRRCSLSFTRPFRRLCRNSVTNSSGFPRSSSGSVRLSLVRERSQVRVRAMRPGISQQPSTFRPDQRLMRAWNPAS